MIVGGMIGGGGGLAGVINGKCQGRAKNCRTRFACATALDPSKANGRGGERKMPI